MPRHKGRRDANSNSPATPLFPRDNSFRRIPRRVDATDEPPRERHGDNRMPRRIVRGARSRSKGESRNKKKLRPTGKRGREKKIERGRRCQSRREGTERRPKHPPAVFFAPPLPGLRHLSQGSPLLSFLPTGPPGLPATGRGASPIQASREESRNSPRPSRSRRDRPIAINGSHYVARPNRRARGISRHAPCPIAGDRIIALANGNSRFPLATGERTPRNSSFSADPASSGVLEERITEEEIRAAPAAFKGLPLAGGEDKVDGDKD